MGARALRQALLQPLLDIDGITARLDAVGELVADRVVAEQLAERLHDIYDIERLCARATAGRANAKDLRALCVSLQQLPAILAEMQNCDAGLLRSVRERIDPLAALAERLDCAIVDSPPVLITEGGIIREGYSDELDGIRHGAAGGREWIASFQDVERGRTGIRSLKVGYNKVFGYYIEVSKANIDLVPDYYERKQTLVNGERFITPELKEKEALVLGADERSQQLEHDLFVELRDAVAAEAERLMSTARAVAELDMLVSLAATAVEYGYTRPELDTSDRLVIRDGRHPVVEQALTDELFVPNDTDLDCRDSQLQIVTGPNMAGKSTYLRQVALLALLAQMGSWVPARSYSAGIIDRIFTRVGASDDLATGQSTFMVEMTETANILSNATDRSLIILDEIGRGTSTWDGMSIAWAVAEYIVEQIGAKTLFATHYHHLNELERLLGGVRNLRVTVKEQGDDIIFLRKIVEGGTDRSYGIQVARLAGLPVEVIERAREVLRTLESEDIVATPTRAAASKVAPTIQLKLFEGVRDPVVEKLKSMELDTLSPLEALMRLKQLQDEAKSGD
jgi:DNA mismatch repair protein MutS